MDLEACLFQVVSQRKVNTYRWLLSVLAIAALSVELWALPSDIRAYYPRQKRQAPRSPALNEILDGAEGRLLDPALLSLMFSASGVMPSVGSSSMTNAFSSLCTYPYLYYYYQLCMATGSAGGMSSPFPYSSPSFASPSSSFPSYSPGPSAPETGPGMFGSGPGAGPAAYGGSSPFNGPSYNGHHMNPYAWANSGPSEVPVPSPQISPEVPPPVGTANSIPVGPGSSPGGPVAQNPGSSPSSQYSPPGYPGTRQTYRGSPAGYPGEQGPPRASPILMETPRISPIIQAQPRLWNESVIFPPSNSLVPVFHANNTSSNGSSLVQFPLILGFAGARHNWTVPAIDLRRRTVHFAQFVNLTERLANFGPMVRRRPLLKGSLENSPRTATRIPSEASTTEPKSSALPSTAKVTLGVPKPSVSATKIVKEFERYLGYTFRLLSVGGKSGGVNKIINDMKHDGPSSTTVAPEFQPAFDIISTGFANSSSAGRPECITYHFCLATNRLIDNKLFLGLEVLQIITPFAAQLLNQDGLTSASALAAVTAGAKHAIMLPLASVRCSVPVEC